MQCSNSLRCSKQTHMYLLSSLRLIPISWNGTLFVINIIGFFIETKTYFNILLGLRRFIIIATTNLRALTED